MYAISPSDNDPVLFTCKANDHFLNSIYPAILYKRVLNLPSLFRTKHISKLLADHGWTGAWNGGVYTFHHYHSTAHEVLAFYKGSTILQLGGPQGYQVTVGEGDVLVIPAGMAHMNLGGEFQVKCVGAYDRGRTYDMLYGASEEKPLAEKNIAAVPFPMQDPVFGANYGISEIWSTHIEMQSGSGNASDALVI